MELDPPWEDRLCWNESYFKPCWWEANWTGKKSAIRCSSKKARFRLTRSYTTTDDSGLPRVMGGVRETTQELAINCAVSRTPQLLPSYESPSPNDPPHQEFLKVRDWIHFQYLALER